MDTRELAHTLWAQDGVISRSQLIALGAKDHDIRRLARQRRLVRLHPGVFVDHTGETSWQQRAQAAVRAVWPAALAGRSALPHPPQAAPIEVAVARGRTTGALTGVLIRSQSYLEERVVWSKSPPRLKLEHAAIQVATGARDEAAAFQVLADACHTRETTAGSIARAITTYQRLPRRRLLGDLLSDLETGACSVLERGYLRLVERAHGLPTADRQLRDRTAAGACYRDVVYVAHGLIVELDGRAYHDSPEQRADDLDRDLAVVVERAGLTVRIGYRQVFTDGCRTAEQIGALLNRMGWHGRTTTCPRCS